MLKSHKKQNENTTHIYHKPRLNNILILSIEVKTNFLRSSVKRFIHKKYIKYQLFSTTELTGKCTYLGGTNSCTTFLFSRLLEFVVDFSGYFVLLLPSTSRFSFFFFISWSSTVSCI